MADLDIVQTATDIGNGVSAVQFDLSGSPIDGNLLVVIIAGRDETAETSISPPAGWVNFIDHPQELGDSNARRWIYGYWKVADSDGSGPYGFSGMNTDAGGVFYEIEGVVVVDQTAQADSGTGSSASQTTGTTGTTTAADEFLIGFVILRHGNNTFSWTNSFSVLADLSTGSGQNNLSLGIADRLVSATDTYESTASWTNSNECGAVIATFKIDAVAEPEFTVEAAAESNTGDDLALAAEPVVAVELASEGDTGNDPTLAAEPLINLEAAAESDAATDTALSFDVALSIEAAAESDTATDTALSIEPVVTIETGNESDVAVDIFAQPEPALDLEIPTESDVASELTLETDAPPGGGLLSHFASMIG
jgi:hypothetical protein